MARGTLLDQLRETEGFLRRSLAADYPVEVFREAVASALLHRDYAIGWMETSVRLYDDRIEVASAGLLVGGDRHINGT